MCQESGHENPLYHHDNLVNSVLNLFAAGTDTTAVTLQWCLLLMAKYPHFQGVGWSEYIGLARNVAHVVLFSPNSYFFDSVHPDQVQEELTRAVGSRQVRVEDRKDLPFTDAVIHESQRLANVVPMAIPHKTSQDVIYEGYFIEKVSRPLLTKVHTRYLNEAKGTICL